MSDGKNDNFVEGRWEDIVADLHRFDGKTVRVSVIEESVSQEELQRSWMEYFSRIPTQPVGEANRIPLKAEREKIIGEVLDEKARREGWFK